MARDYEAEIIEALRLKPRSGASIQNNLGVEIGELSDTLVEMEKDGIIYWDGEKRVWQLVN